MHIPLCKLVAVLPVFVCILNAVVSEDAKKPKLDEVIADEAIKRKLKDKKLVTLIVTKPEDCVVLSEKHDEVQVHYTGYLETGEIFDSSEKSGKEPITFTLGSGQVIRGWDEGLLNMCEGEKRRLIIPPDLAYGKAGFPPVIPPDATLLFEVTLLGLRKPSMGSDFRDPEFLIQIVKFLFLPGIIFFIFCYMYKRYKAEAKAAKEQKHQSRGKNSRKKK